MLEKEKLYIINERVGQYELTTTDNYNCFYMSDTMEYEYFSPEVLVVEYKEENQTTKYSLVN